MMPGIRAWSARDRSRDVAGNRKDDDVNEERSILRGYIERYVPDGFRDEEGVEHEGPHRAAALSALDALVAENQRLRQALERNET
jgi:hypothetical protein